MTETQRQTHAIVVGSAPPAPAAPLSAIETLIKSSLTESLRDVDDPPIQALYDVLRPYFVTAPEGEQITRGFEAVRTVGAIKQLYTERIRELERDLELSAAKHEWQLDEARKAHKDRVEELRKEHNVKLEEIRKEHQAQLGQQAQQYEVRVKEKEQGHQNLLGLVKSNAEDASERLRQELEKTETERRALQDQIDRIGTLSIYDGSITRAEMWKQLVAKIDDRELNRRLPSTRATTLSQSEQRSVNRLLERIDRKTWTRETPAFYKAVLKCLGPILNAPRVDDDIPGIELMDTHGRTDLLDGYAPDVAISTAGHRKAMPHELYGILEFKVCEDAELETATRLGQAYDYVRRVQKRQPERKKFFAVLSNVRKNVVITLEGTVLRKYSSVDLRTLLLFLRHSLGGCTGDSDFKPPPLAFSLPSSDLTKLLGSSRRNIVAAFKYEGETIAVKCTRTDISAEITDEINILERIKSTAGRPHSLPELVYHDAGREFGMKPVGKPFALVSHSCAETFQAALHDILGALTWLHGLGIIHRDIRIDNVILHEPHGRRPHPVIIDFDHAIDISADEELEVLYEGGYICCPPELVCDAEFDILRDTYRPRRRHDFQGFVLLVLQCLLPARFKGFRSYNLVHPNCDERNDLKQLWDDLKASAVWKPFVEEVWDKDTVDCAMLERMAQVYMFPKRRARAKQAAPTKQSTPTMQTAPTKLATSIKQATPVNKTKNQRKPKA
ncbi:hypothetical protein FN846DRAFT_894182 [Sphaerosporella brunnea]|uniref:EKC/KEOPS complex subunit BUD32 n=1 Tax=Sphaerosporella brunnea TaxID=1250544 RepID=A0A5J5EJ27_9PEZI|nr:hypothetical protein FN846DRAFT_894182 [Sphaerosporella brunnea]